jgi:arylformamidase
MSNMKVVDLTFNIEQGMTTFPVPWHPHVEINIMGRLGIEKRETRRLVLGTHTGTHCDAPRHFIEGGRTIDEMEPELLVGEAALIDLRDVPEKSEVGLELLQSRMPDEVPSRVVLRYDWCGHWGDMSYYSDHPFLSEAAAQWLIDQGVKLLAMDTPMPDNPEHGMGCDIDSPIHKIILGNDAMLVEYLCNLKELNGPRIHFIVAPIKVRDGDGAPARCFGYDLN